MHAVSKIDPAAAQTPPPYQQRSAGFRHATYPDRAVGSALIGTRICLLVPKCAICWRTVRRGLKFRSKRKEEAYGLQNAALFAAGCRIASRPFHRICPGSNGPVSRNRRPHRNGHRSIRRFGARRSRRTNQHGHQSSANHDDQWKRRL
jgi:hypothetical protein